MAAAYLTVTVNYCTGGIALAFMTYHSTSVTCWLLRSTTIILFRSILLAIGKCMVLNGLCNGYSIVGTIPSGILINVKNNLLSKFLFQEANVSLHLVR